MHRRIDETEASIKFVACLDGARNMTQDSSIMEAWCFDPVCARIPRSVLLFNRPDPFSMIGM